MMDRKQSIHCSCIDCTIESRDPYNNYYHSPFRLAWKLGILHVIPPRHVFVTSI